MKGIIIAAGHGTRLEPLTRVISKPLLPVYDKPMIYYPLSCLMQLGIKDILIITTPDDYERFINLLGDGRKLGITIGYEIEHSPKGIAGAFIIGEKFIGNEEVALILGDNIFHGLPFKHIVKKRMIQKGATIFGYQVHNPQDYGVVELNKEGNAVSIQEKPLDPKSNYAILGLYFFDDQVIEFARTIEPSERGELEISDVNKEYLQQNALHVEILDDSITWFDTGTHASLVMAARYIEMFEKRNNQKIGCIEEIAYKEGFISFEQLQLLANGMIQTDYGQYLSQVPKLKRDCQ